MSDDGKNGVSLAAIQRLQFEISNRIGVMDGRLDGMDKRLCSIETHVETLANGYVNQGQQIGLIEQRSRQHSEEILALQHGQIAQAEKTGRFQVAIASKDSEEATKRQIRRAVAALLGALVAGGGLTWLIQLVTK